MAIELVWYLPFFVGITFFILGRTFKDWPTGFLGGLVLFVYGVGVIISEIPRLPSMISYVVGVTCLAFGAYVMIRGGMEAFGAE